MFAWKMPQNCTKQHILVFSPFKNLPSIISPNLNCHDSLHNRAYPPFPNTIMAQMMISDAFAQAKRHLATTTPPSVLLTIMYDREGGCRFDGFDFIAWNKWCMEAVNQPAVTKEGVSKNGRPYKYDGFFSMFRYAVSFTLVCMHW